MFVLMPTRSQGSGASIGRGDDGGILAVIGLSPDGPRFYPRPDRRRGRGGHSQTRRRVGSVVIASAPIRLAGPRPDPSSGVTQDGGTVSRKIPTPNAGFLGRASPATGRSASLRAVIRRFAASPIMSPIMSPLGRPEICPQAHGYSDRSGRTCRRRSR